VITEGQIEPLCTVGERSERRDRRPVSGLPQPGLGQHRLHERGRLQRPYRRVASMVRLQDDDAIRRPLLDAPTRSERSRIEIEDLAVVIVSLKWGSTHHVGHVAEDGERRFLDPAGARACDDPRTPDEDMLVALQLITGTREPKRKRGLTGTCCADEKKPSRAAPQACGVQQRGLRAVVQRACEQVHVEIFDHRSRTQHLLDDRSILYNAEMGSQSLDRNDDFARWGAADLRVAVEEPNRFEHAAIRRLQNEPTVERARDYFESDSINPSLTRESMHARISS
jgi:hypothetical protein